MKGLNIGGNRMTYKKAVFVVMDKVATSVGFNRVADVNLCVIDPNHPEHKFYTSAELDLMRWAVKVLDELDRTMKDSPYYKEEV